MQAVIVGADGPHLVSGHPVPEPGPGEALIRMIRAGICNTDLEILKGYAGFSGVLGHEFLGVVERVEENERVKVGDRVVGEINVRPAAGCDCAACVAGGTRQRNHCKRRTVVGILGHDGVFAAYISLPAVNLYVVPPAVSDARAVFAEPLAAAFRIVEQEVIQPGDKVAVVGDGKLGLLIAMVMKTQPISELVVFGRHQEKMSLLPTGAEGTAHIGVVVDDENTAELCKDTFDVCIEASGSPKGIMMAATITRPMGTVVLKTTCAANASDFSTTPFVVKELKVVGSRCGNFEMALAALEQGLPVDRLLAKCYPLSEALEAIAHAGRRGTLKVQIVMEEK